MCNHHNKVKPLSRRQLLRRIMMAAGGTMAASPFLSACSQLTGENPNPALAVGQRGVSGPRRFLIVVGATGGASIIDSFLAIRETESANAQTINTFPDAMVQQVGAFRAVDQDITAIGPITLPNGQTIQTYQSVFASKHQDDMLVVTQTGSSVNHAVAQQRAVTGGGSWAGRTLQELSAAEYGQGLAIPNVAMSNVGYSQRGADGTMPASVYGVPVANPALWPLGLDGSAGMAGAPPANLVALAREARAKIDGESNFLHTFQQSNALNRWLLQREQGKTFEQQNLITQLNFLPDGQKYPLSQYGLTPSPDGAAVRAAFPNYDQDPIESQAALAYLLIKSGVSSTVTIAPTFDVKLAEGFELGQLGQTVTLEDILFNPPLAFDLSHVDHRTAQAFMWKRTLGIVDRLIDLLKLEQHPEAPGDSLYDHTMIYVATDFGRDKVRPSGATAWGTGHELNNGSLIVSPLVNGNRILGGVDPDTGYTYGYDPVTGAPDPGRQMEEKETFAGILTAMGIDTSGSGLPTVTTFS